jgi:hypothetical protein
MKACTHGYDNPKHCTECMFEGNVQADPVTTVAHPFTAKYAGTCAVCSVPIFAGDKIWKRSDSTLIHYKHAPRRRGRPGDRT